VRIWSSWTRAATGLLLAVPSLGPTSMGNGRGRLMPQGGRSYFPARGRSTTMCVSSTRGREHAVWCRGRVVQGKMGVEGMVVTTMAMVMAWEPIMCVTSVTSGGMVMTCIQSGHTLTLTRVLVAAVSVTSSGSHRQTGPHSTGRYLGVARHGAHFSTENCTRGCNWFPRLLT
jgi:hypothetical protein